MRVMRKPEKTRKLCRPAQPMLKSRRWHHHQHGEAAQAVEPTEAILAAPPEDRGESVDSTARVRPLARRHFSSRAARRQSRCRFSTTSLFPNDREISTTAGVRGNESDPGARLRRFLKAQLRNRPQSGHPVVFQDEALPDGVANFDPTQRRIDACGAFENL